MLRFQNISFRFVSACVVATMLTACNDDISAPTVGRAVADRTAGEGDQASAAAHRDLAALRDTLLAADSAWAAYGSKQNLIESLAAPIAPDGIFLAPGDGFVRGPDAVRALLRQNPANAASKWHWVTIRTDVSSD